MLAESEMMCPVCRARQVPQSECRRCKADLSLYRKALRSWDLARRKHGEARREGNTELAEQSARYLKWLRPNP